MFECCKKLGFRVLEEASPDNRWYGSTLALQDEADGPMIWIWRLRDGENRAVCDHLVFSANGRGDEVYGKIVAAGIACKPPFPGGWGGRELVLHDPESNELLFL